MARTTQAPDENTTYERLPDEPDEAWGCFVIYRDMGPRLPGKPGGRSIDNVRVSLGKPEGYLKALEGWSRRWQWIKRARKYDADIEAKDRKAGEKKIPYWARMRDRSHRLNMKAAQDIRKKVRQMVKRSIDARAIQEVNGREVLVLAPKWSVRDIATLSKVAAELEAATISDALFTSEDTEGFDVQSASIEQLRDFITRNTRGKTSGPNEG